MSGMQMVKFATAKPASCK